MMRRISLLLSLLVFMQAAIVKAQPQATVQEGEFGLSLGAAHYFGDLNNKASFNRPKFAMGAFYRKQVGDYVGIRFGVHYAQLGYSDIYSTNEFQLRRNLSFNTNVWEVALQGDFNFFRFVPGDPDHMFTPYITLGIGIFSYDPYAYLQGQKYYLRPLGTEGQGSAFYPERQLYGQTAFCFPLGMGIKYNLNPAMNLGFEVAYRFTGTDYLDDVSTTFAGPASFPPDANGNPTIASLLQDRSYETGSPIGVAGRQRGFSSQKDGYLFAELTLGFNLTSYRCPSAR
jgi:opacity protein-like surface antigen